MTQQDGATGATTGVATVAKDQAGEVGRTAADAGGQVAQTTKEQAQNVVGEAKQQARDLVGEARMQVRDQAGSQKGRAVEQLRTFGDELQQMGQQGGQSGIATEVARQVAERTHGLADYLDRHEPADLLEDLRRYARRRPVVFLAGAAVAGVLAGRLTRNLASNEDQGGGRHELGSVDRGYASPAIQPAYAESYPAAGTGYDQGAGYVQGAGYDQGGYDQGGYAQGTGYVQPTPGVVEPGYAEPGYAGQPAGYPEPDYPGQSTPGGYPQTPQTGYGTSHEDTGWRTP